MSWTKVLDRFGEIRSDRVDAVWRAARPLPGLELRPGLYLGRACGMPWPLKQAVRHLVGRDWFAKLVLDGWGVNLRVFQDGRHTPQPSRSVEGGARVDLPFACTAEGLDYGVHLAGFDVPSAMRLLAMRDFLRVISFDAFCRVDGVPPPEAPGELILGLIAPLALPSLAGSPFAMVRRRDATEAEIESAREHTRRRRWLDTSR